MLEQWGSKPGAGAHSTRFPRCPHHPSCLASRDLLFRPPRSHLWASSEEERWTEKKREFEDLQFYKETSPHPAGIRAVFIARPGVAAMPALRLPEGLHREIRCLWALLAASTRFRSLGPASRLLVDVLSTFKALLLLFLHLISLCLQVYAF